MRSNDNQMILCKLLAALARSGIYLQSTTETKLAQEIAGVLDTCLIAHGITSAHKSSASGASYCLNVPDPRQPTWPRPAAQIVTNVGPGWGIGVTIWPPASTPAAEPAATCHARWDAIAAALAKPARMAA